MELRILRPDEWPLLKPIYESEGGQLPNPALSTAVVVKDDQKNIAGFWGLEYVPHAGPLWIRPDFRGKELWRPMHKMLDEVAPGGPNSGYYCFSGSERSEKLFRKLGMEETNMKVWVRRFN